MFRQSSSRKCRKIRTSYQLVINRVFDGPIITKNGNRVHCYGTIRFWNVQERREISRGATSVPGSFAMLSVIWRAVMSSARRAQKDVPLSRAARMGTFRCRGPPRTSAPTSVQVYSVVRELWAVRFGDAQGGRDFTRNNFRTRVVCDVVCDLVGRDVLGAPRTEGRSIVAGRVHGDVPLSRAAEDVGPYQRSGLQRRSRVVGRSVRGCPGRKRFHAEQLPYPDRLRCRL